MPDAFEYDFSSVGESTPVLAQTVRADAVVPININPKTPLELSMGSSGLFVMNTNTRDAIRDNLKNLLLTNWGERPCQYDFGANLKELTMELGTSSFDAEAGARIKATVKKYMPFVELTTFKIQKVPSIATQGLGAVRVLVKYSVPKANITTDGLVITLLASG